MRALARLLAVATPACLAANVVRQSTITVADALVAAAEMAAAAVDSSPPPRGGSGDWLVRLWADAGKCLRHDYLYMNATCTDALIADAWDPCSVFPPKGPELYSAAYYRRVLSPAALRRTAAVMEAMAPAAALLLPGTLRGTVDLPAVVHQTWSKDDVGEEVDFKAWMDAWECEEGEEEVKEAPPEPPGAPAGGGGGGGGDGVACWRHVVWTDARLNRLMGAVVPWLPPMLRAMRLDRPVDKIDMMRYVLLFVYGGVYLDADQVTRRQQPQGLGADLGDGNR